MQGAYNGTYDQCKLVPQQNLQLIFQSPTPEPSLFETKSPPFWMQRQQINNWIPLSLSWREEPWTSQVVNKILIKL